MNKLIFENKELFIDDWASFTTLLTEDLSGDKPIIIEGKMQQGDVLNGNGRVYLAQYLAENVDRLQPIIKARKLYGELDHPSVPVISYKNASHLIIDAKFNESDKSVIGRYQILRETPAGMIVKGILKEQGCLSTSSRALGNAKPAMLNGENASVIGKDMKVLTWDLVTDNSTPGCDHWQPINESMIHYIGDSMNKDGKKIQEKKLREVIRLVLRNKEI